jgi:hypothetical protein
MYNFNKMLYVSAAVNMNLDKSGFSYGDIDNKI